MQNGQVYELVMPERHTSDSESLSLPTPRANEPGSTSVGYGDSLNDFANRVVNGYARKDLELLRTPVASEAEGGAVAPDVAKANGQTLRLSGQMIDMVAPDQLPKLPTPTVSDQYTANLSSTQQKEGSMHSVTLAQVFHKPDLFPTPNTMDHLDARTGEARERQLHRGGSNSRRNTTGNLREDIIALMPTPNTLDHLPARSPEKIAESKLRTSGGYSNVRETVVNDLFPTPITSDYKNGKSSAGYGLNLPETARSLFPTPVASEGTKAPSQQTSATKSKTGQVWLSNVAKDLEPLLGTPRATAANSSSKQVELGAPKSRLEDQVHTNWGKFEPAIRRWEAIIGRPAPEPTKPDGKEGNHRLSSKFTEWMMGLPDGWITDIGLKRNDELKACGNGVVPQQAELALSLLGIKEILERN
jgi:hypothetical protein